MNTDKVSFVIPTKNEQATIEHIITSIKRICLSNNIPLHEIIITDDSVDNTRKIAQKNGAKVVVGGGKGLGSAMLKGLKQAASGEPTVVISIDADGQVDLEEITTFLDEFKKQDADLVLGSRFLKENLIQYSYPVLNRFGKTILTMILRKLTGLKLTDSHGGIRAISLNVIKELELIGTHTYVQESIIDAKENGFKVVEIPSRWLKREYGESRVVSSIPKYIFYTLPVLILRSGRHINYLFSAGMLLTLLAFIDITYVLFDTNFSFQEIIERQSLVLFFTLMSAGVNLFFFGVVLELLSQLKRKN